MARLEDQRAFLQSLADTVGPQVTSPEPACRAQKRFSEVVQPARMSTMKAPSKDNFLLQSKGLLPRYRIAEKKESASLGVTDTNQASPMQREAGAKPPAKLVPILW